ncbi:MAG: integrase arm-type DNA-binding domain-containing protein [Proteobacteria bacterium]|nr:integrase arm-type DNA-binding domain-containing protein [Pseudomonadota bacterium]MBU0968583.1 integrase arm-type DNA-binding domain-containing protein [Pseudomonadota bacterium]
MPKRTTPLTDTQIRSMKPDSKDIKLFDGGGLFLLVKPTGGKLWRFKYRFGGREKLLSLGAYPQISLSLARQRREEARTLIAKGIDPGAARKEQEAAILREQETFEVVAREWHNQFLPQWAPRTAEAILDMLSLDVFGEIGNQPIASINAPLLLNMLRRIEARGANYTAHRVRGLCSQIFRYGVATGRCERDPTADLKGALTPIKTTHRAATTDPKEVAPLLRMLDGYQGTLVVRCALRLLPLLFVRPGELRTMLWADVDLEKGEWSYMVNKTKTPHIVPLAKQAVAILREIHPLSGNDTYVFPSARTNTRPMSDMAMNAAMRRMGIDTKTEITGHGFRAVARTILDEVLGFRPDFIEHQLAHAVRDPLGRAYNRTAHLPERKKMMQAWADYLDGLKQGAEIIPLHMKAAGL